MSLPRINVCPSTLAEGFHSYSPLGLRRVFGGKRVSHILPWASPGGDQEAQEEAFIENRKRLSISGVQEKLSLVLERNRLRLTGEEEQGTYILKPVPRDIRKPGQVPANEHLTMQIARQVFDIATAENALAFFNDGKPAYITKRFDVNEEDGGKWRTEDFASLAGLTADNGGANFKYASSYEEIGLLIRRYVPAWPVEIEKFFKLVVFNWLFSNGDAHLKNFSILETPAGDFILSPAYDLLNTSIHVNDSNFAFEKGLFADGARSVLWQKTGHPNQVDFKRFAAAIGIADRRIDGLLQPFIENHELTHNLISNSFLEGSVKRQYGQSYNRKVNLLKG